MRKKSFIGAEEKASLRIDIWPGMWYKEKNKRKATTETSSPRGSIQRERRMLKAVYAEARRKPFPSRGAEPMQ